MIIRSVPPERIYTKSSPKLESPNKLVGYIARFGEESCVLHESHVCKEPFVEVIAPGAFTRTLAEADIRALYDHDTGKPLGRTKAGTLKLWEDDQGLRFENLLPDTTVGRDARESIERGDIDGCSFFGYVLDDEIVSREGLPALRTIFEIELVEVTPACCFPAYESTSVALRSKRHDRTQETPRPLLKLTLLRLRLSAD